MSIPGMTDDEKVLFRNAARDLYQTEDCEIDDDPKFSDCRDEGEGGVWVAAWVWVATAETEVQP